MVGWLPKAVKQSIKGRLKQARLAWIRRWHAFGPDELLAALGRVGVTAGSTLLVHSSLDRFEGFTGKATDVIKLLQQAVGESGTLLMPTSPFSGSALDYAAQKEVLDVARTPSQLGLLTELFRRTKGVVRSVHPTHPVAAWGANAVALTADHYLAATPCGRQTPFGRLLDFDGKILFLGARIKAMSFFHTVEELLEPQMPYSPFTREEFELSCKEPDGTVRTIRTRLFDRQVSRRRNIPKMIPELKRAGEFHEVNLGRLPLILVRASAVWDACRTLAGRRVYCYDD